MCVCVCVLFKEEHFQTHALTGMNFPPSLERLQSSTPAQQGDSLCLCCTIISDITSSQVAGVNLLQESGHSRPEETSTSAARRTPPPTGAEKSVRAGARERGKEGDDVPSAAPLLLPPRTACDGYSPVLGSPRVTVPSSHFLCS